MFLCICAPSCLFARGRLLQKATPVTPAAAGKVKQRDNNQPADANDAEEGEAGAATSSGPPGAASVVSSEAEATPLTNEAAVAIITSQPEAATDGTDAQKTSTAPAVPEVAQ